MKLWSKVAESVLPGLLKCRQDHTTFFIYDLLPHRILLYLTLFSLKTDNILNRMRDKSKCNVMRAVRRGVSFLWAHQPARG